MLVPVSEDIMQNALISFSQHQLHRDGAKALTWIYQYQDILFNLYRITPILDIYYSLNQDLHLDQDQFMSWETQIAENQRQSLESDRSGSEGRIQVHRVAKFFGRAIRAQIPLQTLAIEDQSPADIKSFHERRDLVVLPESVPRNAPKLKTKGTASDQVISSEIDQDRAEMDLDFRPAAIRVSAQVYDIFEVIFRKVGQLGFERLEYALTSIGFTKFPDDGSAVKFQPPAEISKLPFIQHRSAISYGSTLNAF
ncbi:hypothetical protein C8J56DRAFT_1025799 [Mycena floridula]|nr:hypothetical protein C8J56DRAFT_1025799 [Mycena floridula]